MVSSLNPKNIVKKYTKKARRFHSERFMRVKRSWRFPHGIDNSLRRRFKGCRPTPRIGYGSNKKTKFLLPSGFYKFTVNNVKDLELLLMHNRRYAAEIASNVSSKKRKAILARAVQLVSEETSLAFPPPASLALFLCS
jgi:large subunit ribosomal protein L32e